MRFPPFLLVALLALAPWSLQAAGAPEVAELSFDRTFENPDALVSAKAPKWVTKVEQLGGRFVDDPKAWKVDANQPQGTGRLTISLDRTQIGQNLVATILFEAGAGSDLAVQLFDGQGRVVVLDLFGNLVDVGLEARTDTVIIPLRKYPTAEKIVLRRVSGAVSVYGVVLFPVVLEGEPDKVALQELANVLGDPLSPENPLLKGLQQIAKGGKVTMEKVKPAASPVEKAPASLPREQYAGATPPALGTKVVPAPTNGLVGWWTFDDGTGSDASGKGYHGQMRGGAKLTPGLHGGALAFRPNPSSARTTSWDSVTMPARADLPLSETMTISAWIKYASIAPNWGSQIAWFGDSQFGRDPWQLHLWTDGTLEFRSDRSVTGQPKFTIFEDEIQLSPAGKPMLNQHVGVSSPNTLKPESWYFVAATVEKVSARQRSFKLYVNGEMVNHIETEETVNYPTEKMWMTIGGVDLGTWQNFAGAIDDVRLYDRPLSGAEITTLYQQPWK